MSSTRAGSRFALATTCLRVLTRMPSRVVSLKPPLWAFVRGVRIARVMTMSSGFLVVLSRLSAIAALLERVVSSYRAATPPVEGVMCETMDLRRSVILGVCARGGEEDERRN